MEKNYVWKNDDFFQCGYVIQEEFVGNHYRVNLLNNSVIAFLVKPCGRTTRYNWKTDKFKLIRKLINATDNLGMRNWILKFDIIISDADYVALDIGVDPPFRLKKLFEKNNINFEKFYIDVCINRIASFPEGVGLTYEY